MSCTCWIGKTEKHKLLRIKTLGKQRWPLTLQKSKVTFSGNYQHLYNNVNEDRGSLKHKHNVIFRCKTYVYLPKHLEIKKKKKTTADVSIRHARYFCNYWGHLHKFSASMAEMADQNSIDLKNSVATIVPDSKGIGYRGLKPPFLLDNFVDIVQILCKNELKKPRPPFQNLWWNK